ncbi:hypothetical protein LCGC14_1244140 [marine sediment metagenome]|uniref:Uncharacterized protein n=1 Tax=marine sediment metagenome TaxID=412755 RepID=A0A0F9P915_9ZZZZ
MKPKTLREHFMELQTEVRGLKKVVWAFIGVVLANMGVQVI